MRIYITGRNAYVEVHGFQLKLIPQPDCSVIQGSKCNTTLYTIYTLDVTELETVMKEPETYKTIVGKDKTVTNITEQSSTGYIDEVRHVIGATNKDTQEIHINDLYALLKMVYCSAPNLSPTPTELCQWTTVRGSIIIHIPTLSLLLLSLYSTR